MKVLRLFAFALAALIAVPAAAQDTSAVNMDILRQKIKTDRRYVVAVNMDLTATEAKEFWPVYDLYQADLNALNGRLGELIQRYADLYQTNALTDEAAKRLLEDALVVAQDEVNLQQAYVPKLVVALPAAKVARYLQIENKIRAAIKYELASDIPLIP